MKKKIDLGKVQFHSHADKEGNNPYPGVFYIESSKHSREGKLENVYYIRYRKGTRFKFERVGCQCRDKMTGAKAYTIRENRVKGKELSNREKREKVREAKKAEASKWVLAKLFEEYQTQHPGKDLANEKSRFNNYLSPAFGRKMPEEIAPLDVDRLRLSLLKKLKPATVLAILELFRRLVNFGVDRHLCAGLSFKVKMPSVDNLKTEDLNAEQMARLLKVLRGERLDDDPPDADTSVDPDARDVVYLALFTGMRRGEILKLKWEDVDARRGFLTIRNPKGGKDQTIPLSAPAREVLEARPRTEDPYIFPGRFSDPGEEVKPREGVKRGLDRIRERAKLPEGFRPLHGLRHVFASHLASSGEVDLYTLQRLLTHKTPLMTQRYAHLRDDALRRAAELAGRIVGEAKADQAKEGTSNE
jgi:integrase